MSFTSLVGTLSLTFTFTFVYLSREYLSANLTGNFQLACQLLTRLNKHDLTPNHFLIYSPHIQTLLTTRLPSFICIPTY